MRKAAVPEDSLGTEAFYTGLANKRYFKSKIFEGYQEQIPLCLTLTSGTRNMETTALDLSKGLKRLKSI